MSMGSITAKIMRMPWKCPAFSGGVRSRISADRAAVTTMKPLMSTVPAAITGRRPLAKNMPRSPSSITPAAGSTTRSLPRRSIGLPMRTLTKEAMISTTPSTKA